MIELSCIFVCRHKKVPEATAGNGAGAQNAELENIRLEERV
jgi:hypothetical protein